MSAMWWLCLACVAFVMAACTSVTRIAEVQQEAWPRWEAHQPGSTERIDHSQWDRFLATYTVLGEDGIVRLAYGRVTEADKASLDAYVAALGQVPVSRLDRPEQLAFWANLYNALAVKIVLDHYPVATIRELNLSPGITEWGPLGAKLASVEGEQVSLDDILHRILRPIWREPRVHYLINPAAIGAPNLLRRAVTAANLNELMTQGGRDYVNHPRAVTVRGGEAQVSSIYAWYESDFGGGEKGVIAHLRRFAAPELGALLARSRGISGDQYDWTLNVVE
jgi:hypothetical protein